MVVVTSGCTIFFSAITVIACMMALMVFPLNSADSIAQWQRFGYFSCHDSDRGCVAIGVDGAWQNRCRPYAVYQKHKSDSAFWKRVASVTTEHPVLSIIAALTAH